MGDLSKAHGPTNPATTADSAATDGTELTDEQLNKVVGGTLTRSLIRPLSGQSPSFASLTPGTQQSVASDMADVGDL